MSDISCTVTVENRVEELMRIYVALDAFAGQSQLPEPARRALALVVEELFTNVVRHGYEDDTADSVVLTMQRDGEDVTLTVSDRGKPFDAARAPTRPNDNQTLDDAPVGGLGLFLVHEFARSVTSRQDGEVNVTEVLLSFDAKTEAVPSA